MAEVTPENMTPTSTNPIPPPTTPVIFPTLAERMALLPPKPVPPPPRSDKAGLERSVLTYVDISTQQSGKFYLVIDESYGKALFTVDDIQVLEHEIVGLRYVTPEEGDPITEVVTRFSPHLTWRAVNTADVYLQSTREVMEKELLENKDVRAFREQLLKDAGLDKEGMLTDTLTGAQTRDVGQYL